MIPFVNFVNTNLPDTRVQILLVEKQFKPNLQSFSSDLRIFDVLPNFSLTANETMGDYSL